MKKILFFTLVILTIASCSENLPDAELQPVQPGTQSGNTIRATTANTQTKTTIAYGNEDLAAGEISRWSEGDAFAVIFLNENDEPVWTAVTYTIKPGDGGNSTAEFIANSSLPGEGTYKIRAVYPVIMCYDIPILNFIGQTQNGANANHIGGHDPMIAELPSVYVDSNGNAEIDLTFQHFASMLRFRLKNDIGNDTDVHLITVRSGNPLNRFYNQVRFDATSANLFQSYDDLQASLTCENSTVAHGGAISDFYMALPGNIVVDDSADLIISVHFGEGEVQEFVIPASSTAFLRTPFAPGMRYYFNLTLTGGNI